MITAQISMFAFYAARAILFFLFFLSFLTVGFFIERLIFFAKHFMKDNAEILQAIEDADSLKQITDALKDSGSAEADVVMKGLDKGTASNHEFEKKVGAYLKLEREKWERFSLFLGSVGSNAPFIGLLGTVLGILKSFADLAGSTQGGQQAVMSGISEALVVTAVGLAVAIPAIVFFNICKSRVKRSVTSVESIVDLISSKNVFGE